MTKFEKEIVREVLNAKFLSAMIHDAVPIKDELAYEIIVSLLQNLAPIVNRAYK